MFAKVYINENGKFYKVTGPKLDEIKPKSPVDAERSVVTKEFIEVLPDDGTAMFLVDIDAKIQTLLASR